MEKVFRRMLKGFYLVNGVFLYFLLLNQNIQAQNWTPVPLVSQKILDNGNSGGEGCQVIQAIEADHESGSFLLMGTDVGGIYRSIDGGSHWTACNLGYSARGNAGFAIDPNNSHRALAVGANSTTNFTHGLYLTTDMGASWSQVLAVSSYAGQGSLGDKIDFVKASFDSVEGYTALAYWSNPGGGVYCSTDGGQNWKMVNANFGNCRLKVNPKTGAIYVISGNGFYTSADSAKTFSLKMTGVFTDMDVVDSLPDWVFLASATSLYISQDGGENFEKRNNSTYPKNVVSLCVSPANPNYMLACDKVNDWGGPNYTSVDGGINWSISSRNNDDAFMPYNDRIQKYAWHPKDPMKVWALGGDWISSSHDGGKHFFWDANGYNAILAGGLFNFNPHYPDVLFIASQDYNGAVTLNYGHTWTYCNPSHQGWGGFTYGAYAANKNVLITQNCSGWGADGYLTISRDGGKTFNQTTLLCTGLDVGCSDPMDSSILFFSNYRSTDFGVNWEKMTGCTGVLCVNEFGGHELYGADSRYLVRSDDHGKSWTRLKTMPGNIADVAIDHRTGKLYIVTAGNRIFTLESGIQKEITSLIPADQFNNRTVSSVAIDIQDPDLVYIAGPMNIYKTDATIKRSMDGGASWEIYNPNLRTNNGLLTGDGVNEVFAIRVNPATRELWAAGGCYGIWRDQNINKNTINLSMEIVSPSYTGYLLAGDSLSVVLNMDQKGDSIVLVDFLVDDSIVFTDSLRSGHYNFRLSKSGDISLKAIATELNGNKIFAPPINLNVHASLPPSVEMKAPVADSIYPAISTLNLYAVASDVDGTVAKVEFFVDGSKIGESTSEPFAIDWSSSGEGTHIFVCMATDNSGEHSMSAPVQITFFGQEGMVNYYENFNDGIAQKWRSVSGSWKVQNQEFTNTNANGTYIAIYDGSSFSHYTYTVSGRADWGNNFGLVFNFRDNQNYYMLLLDANPLTASLSRVKNGISTSLANSVYTGGGQGTEITCGITNEHGKTTVSINGNIVFDTVATSDFMDGKIGLYTSYNPVYFDEVKVEAAARIYTGLKENEVTNSFKIKVERVSSGENTFRIILPSQSQHINYELIDLSGNNLESGQTNNTDSFIIQANPYISAGLYILHITGDGVAGTSKIIYL